MSQGVPGVLVFGGTGAIGSAVVNRFHRADRRVVVVTRSVRHRQNAVRWDPLNPEDEAGRLEIARQGPFDAICWAQGMNCNDSVYDCDLSLHEQLYRANCLFVVASLGFLLKSDQLLRPTRMCVISSIWQNLSRQKKFSYGMTKAALKGLVLSAANDMARDGHLINAVLPGVLDTPMTRQNLDSGQIDRVMKSTLFNRLPTPEDVASAVYFLCSEANTGTTAQFVKVDLGYSDVRVI